MITILSFIFVFGVIVLIHEFGHFAAAKKMGAAVEEFGLGFGPRLASKKIGETRYSLNLLPLGGFVRILGEEGDGKKDDPKNFLSKKPWQKALILLAGVIMNFILAFVILTFAFGLGFKPIVQNTTGLPGVKVTEQKVLIWDLAKDYPAQKASIQKETEVVAVNGQKVMTSEELIKKINDSQGQTLNLELRKDGKAFTREVTPVKEDNGYKIGIVPRDDIAVKAPWYWAPVDAFLLSVNMAKLTVIGFFDLIKGIVTKLTISDEATGPVGIAVVTGAVAKLGFSYLLQFMAFLSLTLAVINVLPFPALDGGHLFILALETLTKKKIDAKTKNAIALVGFSLLILLMLAITWKDLIRFDILNQITNKIKGLF